MEPTGEPAQPIDAMIIETAGLNPEERQVATAVAANLLKPLMDAVPLLPPGARPYSIAVGAAQVSDILNRQRRDVFGPGLAEADQPASGEVLDQFPFIRSIPLSDDETTFAANMTIKLTETVLALNQIRPANVRPYALLAALGEAFRALRDSGNWGPENRVPGMPGPDGKQMD